MPTWKSKQAHVCVEVECIGEETTSQMGSAETLTTVVGGGLVGRGRDHGPVTTSWTGDDRDDVVDDDWVDGGDGGSWLPSCHRADAARVASPSSVGKVARPRVSGERFSGWLAGSGGKLARDSAFQMDQETSLGLMSTRDSSTRKRVPPNWASQTSP